MHLMYYISQKKYVTVIMIIFCSIACVFHGVGFGSDSERQAKKKIITRQNNYYCFYKTL